MSKQADRKSLDTGDPADIPPLTRQPTYVRFPRTLSQIQALLHLPRAQLLARLSIADERHPEHVGPEAITFFIRRHRLDDQPFASRLLSILIERCIPQLAIGVRGLEATDREDVQQEVLEKLVSLLLDDSDRSDFAQVRFWMFLKALRLTACSRFTQQLDATDQLDDGHAEALASAQEGGLSPEEMAQMGEGLAALPPRLRQLYVMRHLWGWKLGPEDGAPENPRDPSLAAYFGKTPRTIRNWLKQADAHLARFRKG